jgi:hypothetical protein
LFVIRSPPRKSISDICPIVRFGQLGHDLNYNGRKNSGI